MQINISMGAIRDHFLICKYSKNTRYHFTQGILNRHVGQVCWVSSHVNMQVWWYICLQGISRASSPNWYSSRQIEHIELLSLLIESSEMIMERNCWTAALSAGRINWPSASPKPFSWIRSISSASSILTSLLKTFARSRIVERIDRSLSRNNKEGFGILIAPFTLFLLPSLLGDK